MYCVEHVFNDMQTRVEYLNKTMNLIQILDVKNQNIVGFWYSIFKLWIM